MAGAPVWSESYLAKHRAKEAKRESGEADLPEATEDAPNPLASVQSCTVLGLGVSFNESVSGKRRGTWDAKRAWKDKVVRAAQRQLRKPERFPVRIIWRTYIPEGRNPRDADGAFFASKYGIDCLEACDVIPDDTPEHVESVLLEAPRRGEPMRTEIIIIEV